jgi:hypothetical protein
MSIIQKFQTVLGSGLNWGGGGGQTLAPSLTYTVRFDHHHEDECGVSMFHEKQRK